MRVYQGHQGITRAIRAVIEPAPTTIEMPMATRADGKESTNSTLRMIIIPETPSRYPAHSPKGTPIRAAINTMKKPPKTETRAPKITRLRRSRP